MSMPAWMNSEWALNRLSMFALLGGGFYFIFEGSKYIDMKRQNPIKIPDKMYAAGILTIILGVVSILFGLAHFFMPT